MELAVEEVLILNHTYLEPKHILLGLLKEGEGVAGIILRENKVFLEDIRTIALSQKGREDFFFQEDKVFSPESELVIDTARRWALRFHHNYIGTEHMLLGLYVNPIVTAILEERGLTYKKAPEEVFRRISLH
jgi:ATP-dependent Clp protease ATP-binding subunit ClpC